jgi:hypothetical protein
MQFGVAVLEETLLQMIRQSCSLEGTGQIIDRSA